MVINAFLTQIILFVKDMPRAVHFYHEILGLVIIHPNEPVDFSQTMWVELDAGTCSLALHGGTKESPGDEHNLVFKVDNLQAARQALLAAGVEIGEIRILEDGEPVASGVDPEGHHFSIR